MPRSRIEQACLILFAPFLLAILGHLTAKAMVMAAGCHSIDIASATCAVAGHDAGPFFYLFLSASTWGLIASIVFVPFALVALCIAVVIRLLKMLWHRDTSARRTQLSKSDDLRAMGRRAFLVGALLLAPLLIVIGGGAIAMLLATVMDCQGPPRCVRYGQDISSTFEQLSMVVWLSGFLGAGAIVAIPTLTAAIVLYLAAAIAWYRQ